MNTLIATQKMVPLAPLTTLDLGGPAAQLLAITSYGQALEVVNWWRDLPTEQRPELLPLGGGSNLVVSDLGFPGLVLKMENREIQVLNLEPDSVEVKVEAGVVWDDFVARCVTENWAGVECLSGIPGCVGASPVQNIGAYGQEVSETILRVDGINIQSGQGFRYSNEECRFSYRDSHFKRAGNGRYLITSVTFRLRPGGAPTLRYGELQQQAKANSIETLEELRALVLETRRSKSMVYDPNDPNHRSAGSFFTNPIVSSGLADEIAGSLEPGLSMPRFPAGAGMEKLSAAWLISHCGLPKGFKCRETSRVSLSTKHVLALTNRGGATTAELLELSAHVQGAVRDRFRVELAPEPIFVGF